MNLKINLVASLILSLSTFSIFSQQNELFFFENKGQIANDEGKTLDSIDFKLETKSANLYFTPSGIIYHFHKEVPRELSEMNSEEIRDYNRGDKNVRGSKIYFFRTDFQLIGANPNPEIHLTEPQQFKTNYYLAHCPDGILGVNSYKSFMYLNIYPNIDIRYSLENGQLKYDFILHPGAKVNDIKFKYNGAKNSFLKGNSLIIETDYNTIEEGEPFTYFENSKEEVSSRFKIENDIISFDLDIDQVDQEIIIDPTITWATYYTNNYSSDFHANSAYDSNQNLYVGYATYATAWPVINAGAGQWYDATRDGSNDLVIARINADLSKQWATYYGGDKNDVLFGTGGDYGKSVGVDGNDYVYLGGWASTNPTTIPTQASTAPGAWYQDNSDIKGGDNSYIVKFDPNGVRQWATLYQHTNASTSGAGIRINGMYVSNDKIYFTGQTYQFSGFDIPVVSLAGAYNNSTFVGNQDMFIGRFSDDCVLEWSSYLNSGNTGATQYQQGSDLTMDANGNLILVGQVSGDPSGTYLNNPGGGAYYSNTISGFIDHTITKFNTSLQPTWSTIIGGTDLDRVSEVATDASNNILLAVRTARAGNPTANPGGGAFYYATLQSASGDDGMIMKFSPAGAYTWGTYVGASTGYTSITGIAGDDAGNIYALGYTDATNFPVNNLSGSFYQGTNAGGNDIVMMRFNSASVDDWVTYYGGSGADLCYGRKINPSSIGNSCGYKQIVSITTSSTNLPTVNPGAPAFYESTPGTTNNNALLFIEEPPTGSSASPPSLIAVSQTVNACAGDPVNLSATGGSLGTGDQYVWYTGGCGSGASIGTGASITVNPTSNTTYYVRVEGPCGNTSCTSVSVSVVGTGTEDASWTSPGTVCETAGSFNLNTFVTGDPGGTWSGSGVSGSTFNPSGLSGNINVTYTVGGSACGDQVSQTITVGPNVNPVWSPATICASAGTINLNTLLGSATSGGTWSGTGVSGNNFNPASGTQNITYTVGTAGCTESSTQSLTVLPDVNPSWTSPGATCESSGTINLSSLITGTTGGTWMGTGVSGNTFDPSGLSGSINITYTVGSSPCQESSAQSITVTATPDPSWNSPGTICEANGTIDLSTLITGTTGGTWSGTGVSGTNFNPSGLSGSINVTYQVVSGPCTETSTQSITVSPDVDPSWTNPSPVCESGGTINLNSLITGTPGGTWSGTGVSGNSFDPTGLSGTVNINYSVGSGACVENQMISVTVQATPNPSWSSPGTICEANGTIDLSTLITGTTGGIWTGTGISGTNFDPTGLTGSVSIDYQVGSGACLQNSTQSITVVPDVDPSWTNPGTVCEGAGTVNLNGLLTGTSGGTWSGTNVTGATFDPSGLSGQSINISYTVGNAPCVETLMQTINVQASVNASWSSPGTICEANGAIDLSTLITGSTGGTFSGSGVSGNNFDPSGLSGGISVTYAVGSGTCSDNQAQTITVIPDVDATWTNPSPVCVSNGVIDLNTLVTGTPGGTWAGTGVSGSNFDPSGLAGQTVLITYLVGTAPCQEQEVLSVTVTNTVSAAWTAPTSVCESDGLIDLTAFITGDAGGTFSGPGVTGNNLDPQGLSGSINITYTVGTSPCDDAQIQSITINSAPTAPTVTANSSSICEGDTTSIFASGSGSNITYEIYDAASGGNLLGNAPLVVSPTNTTTYYVIAINTNACSNLGGAVSVTVTVNPLPNADAGQDVSACTGENIILTATGGGTYLWETNETTASITVNASTTQYYSVTVDNGTCSATDSVLVSVIMPGIVLAQNDFLNANSGITASVDAGANDSGDVGNISIISGPFNGSGSFSNGVFTYTSNANFTGQDSVVYVICDASCTNTCDTAVIYISIEDRIDITVPSGFTPNGDGINETLIIDGLSQYPENELLVYNRWGDLVYSATPYNNDWSGQSEGKGTLFGEKVTDGTYFYILKYSKSGEEVILKGSFEIKSK